jgi:hypothetical protein
MINAFKAEFNERLERPIMEEWLAEIAIKTDVLLDNIMNYYEKTPPFTMEELEVVIKSLINGKACGPDGIPPEIFKYGGEKMKKSLLEIMNMIKENKEVPRQWNLVDITTLYKKKGQIKDLVNQRGIFLTVIAYKLMEKLIKNRVKEPQRKINLLQAGGREKRCTADQTFLMRCVINHALYVGRKLFITT